VQLSLPKNVESLASGMFRLINIWAVVLFALAPQSSWPLCAGMRRARYHRPTALEEIETIEHRASYISHLVVSSLS